MSVDVNTKSPGALPRPRESGRTGPLFVAGIILLGGAAAVAAALWGGGRPVLLEALAVALGLVLFGCLWLLRNWVRSAAIWLLALGLIWFAPGAISEVSVQVLGGAQALSLGQALRFVLTGRLDPHPTVGRAVGGAEGQLQRQVNKGTNLHE